VTTLLSTFRCLFLQLGKVHFVTLSPVTFYRQFTGDYSLQLSYYDIRAKKENNSEELFPSFLGILSLCLVCSLADSLQHSSLDSLESGCLCRAGGLIDLLVVLATDCGLLASGDLNFFLTHNLRCPFLEQCDITMP